MRHKVNHLKYKVIEVTTAQEMTDTLNGLLAEGWKLMGPVQVRSVGYMSVFTATMMYPEA